MFYPNPSLANPGCNGQAVLGHRDPCAYQTSKADRIRQGLHRMGFDALPSLVLSPESAQAEPLAVVTGASFSRFDPAKHVDTPTKCFYAPLGRHFLCNTAAAVAVELLDEGRRVVVQCSERDEPLTRALFERHPNGELATVISGDLGSTTLIRDIYHEAIQLNRRSPVSRLDLVLYESYAAGLDRPFIPMFEDSPHNAASVTTRRIETFYNLFMAGYDLLIFREQQELRIIALTALAGRRASANLCTDTLHKVTSSALLETYSIEASYYSEHPVAVIELAPGMVDTGLYDSREVREAVFEEAEMDGFPFDDRVSPADPHSWPMLSVRDLGRLARFYLSAREGEYASPTLQEDFRHLTTAGRPMEQFRCELSASTVEEEAAGCCLHRARALPSFAYVPGTIWNGLPPFQRGYTPIMLSPQGQYF